MLGQLKTRELFASADTRRSVVELIFKKALDEPEHSKLYARICFGLAMYEVSLNEPGTRPKSELRNAIVYTAQNEFRQFKSDEALAEKSHALTQDEKEYTLSQFMRRKRANIRFIGQLFLNDVLSHSTMLVILNITMKEAVDGGFPASENIELLAELLSTVGERLD
uniref:Eukaryotic translation initiation factor 4 gamma 3 n=1 Tax=Lygus hesperus TaxID=30085 RepID=A0A0A9XHC5_LYGHE